MRYATSLLRVVVWRNRMAEEYGSNYISMSRSIGSHAHLHLLGSKGAERVVNGRYQIEELAAYRFY